MTSHYPPDVPMQPPSSREGSGRRNWLVTIAASLLALVVAVAVLWIIRGPSEVRLAPAEIAKASGALAGCNVLLVSIDTLRADHLACYGYRGVRTPVIDRLAAEGVRFAHATSPVPLTLPSHTTMLTGLNPVAHHVRNNGTFKLDAEFTTLAETLSSGGYRTGAVISAFVLDRQFGLAQGFCSDSDSDSDSGSGSDDGYDDNLTRGDQPALGGFRERRAELANAVAIRWLGKNADKRFFMFVHYFDPHSPYLPPSPYREQYKGRPYDGEIAYVDEQFGKLLEALEAAGVRDKTLIILTSDHGESLGEHGEPTHHFFIYDATQHVPLIMAGPAPFPKGHVIEHQVGLVDIVPTVLDLLGMARPGELDGMNALAARREPRPIYIESLSAKLLHGCAPLVGVRRDDAKLIIAPRPELYDLEADPHELENIYGQREDLAGELRASLGKFVGGNLAAAVSARQNLVMTDDAAEKLRGLGYLVGGDRASGPSATTKTTRPVRSEPADPKDMIVHFSRSLRGQQLISRGRFQQGFRLLEQHAELCPSDVYSRHRLAEGYRTAGRLEDSLRIFGKILAQAPDDMNAVGGAGSVLLRLGRVSEAEASFRAMLVHRPNSTDGLMGLAGVEFRRKNYEKALAFFRRVAEGSKGTKTATAYANIGLIHARLGRTDQARESMAKALEIEPGHTLAAKLITQLDQAQGNDASEENIERLRISVRRSGDPDSRLMLGQLLSRADRLEEAARVLAQARSARPDHVETCYQLGSVLARLGKNQDAETVLRQCAQLDAKHAGARSQLGMLVARQGRLDDAARWLRQAASLVPDEPTNYYNLGLVLEGLGRFGKAIDAYRKALGLNPKLAEAHFHLGQCLVAAKQPDRAAEHFRKSLVIKPDYAPARDALKRLDSGGG